MGENPLARPIAIGGAILRNRFVMAPLTTNYGDEDGYATEKAAAFYEERARGGAAALIFEAANVVPRNRITVRQHGLYNDAFIPGLAGVAGRVHAHGALLFAQLCHGGPKAGTALNGVQPVSISAVPVKIGDVPRPMTVEEIEQVVEDFAAAAVRARKAGFDGVELQACHFYLLSASLSGYFNQRTDDYGGSVENRARLTSRVVQAVKARAGDDYPVICRIHGREALPGGIDAAEAAQIARLLAAAGADAIHVSSATLPVNPRLISAYAVKVSGGPDKDTPPGCFVDQAAAIKDSVGVPVIAVGKLNNPAVAERALNDGASDVVAVGRGLIADPYLPRKVLEGRWGDIVTCKDCLTCHTTIHTKRDLGCAVNPRPWRPKGEVAVSYLAQWSNFRETEEQHG